MSKREYRRFMAEQKIEILGESDRPWDDEQGMPAPRLGAVGTVSVARGDRGSEFVNRGVAAVIKAHNLIDIGTKPRHRESNGIADSRMKFETSLRGGLLRPVRIVK